MVHMGASGLLWIHLCKRNYFSDFWRIQELWNQRFFLAPRGQKYFAMLQRLKATGTSSKATTKPLVQSGFIHYFRWTLIYMYYILLDYIFKTIHSEHLLLCAHRWHMKTWHIHIHDRSGLVWIIWLSHNKTNYKSLWSRCLIDANFVCIMVNTTALYQKMLKNWKFRKNLHNLSIRLHILCKMCHLQIEKFDVTVKEVADSNWEYYKTNFVHWKGEETCWKCCSRRIWYTGVRSIV